jgi:DNA-binding MarR family transcriptional regulator
MDSDNELADGQATAPLEIHSHRYGLDNSVTLLLWSGGLLSVSKTQADVLVALESHGPSAIQDIRAIGRGASLHVADAPQTASQRAAMSRMFRRLEERGLTMRKEQQLSLTPRGAIVATYLREASERLAAIRAAKAARANTLTQTHTLLTLGATREGVA